MSRLTQEGTSQASFKLFRKSSISFSVNLWSSGGPTSFKAHRAVMSTFGVFPPGETPPYGILRTALVELSHQSVILPTVGMMEHCKNLSGVTKNCAEEKPRR
jgi:hypothetical protein